MPRVFLSYSRANEAEAEGLRERLSAEPEIEVTRDRLFLEGGLNWWTQLARAIENADFLVLLLTPAAMASGNVAREWRHARQQGVAVYPVKGPGFDPASMPRWMRKA